MVFSNILGDCFINIWMRYPNTKIKHKFTKQVSVTFANNSMEIIFAIKIKLIDRPNPKIKYSFIPANIGAINSQPTDDE